MRGPSRSSIHSVLVLALGAAGTLVHHRSLPGGRGDPRAFTYTLEHWYQSLLGRAPLLSPRIFYPFEGALGYSDTLVGYALPYSVLRALGLEMFSAMQAVVIVFSFLSFLACFVLLHRVLRLHVFGSAAAALFFTFSSPKFVQLGHLQLQFTLLLPLLFALPILFAREALDGRQRRAFVLLALFVVTLHLQLLTTFGYAWFFLFWSLLFGTASLLLASTRRYLVDLWRSSRLAIAGAAGVALAGSVPFVAVYGPAIRETTAYRYENVLAMVPAARNFFDLGTTNLLWGWLSDALQQSPPHPYFHELRVGIGLVPTLAWIGTTLLAVGAAAGALGHAPGAVRHGLSLGGTLRVPHRAGVPMFLAAMVLASWAFIALGMKYGDEASPWRFVHAWVPGAGAVRAVARYVIFLTLPMAIGFAWLIDRALRWATTRRPRVVRGTYAVILALASFGVCEQLGSSGGFDKPLERAYLEALAADLPADCEVFYLAAPRPETPDYDHQFDAMLVSILTGVPTINGLTSQLPRGWNLMVTDPGVYEANVRDWIAREHIAEKVCRLEVGMPIEIVDLGLTIAAWNVQPRDFVRRHYLDLLRREPTREELARWVNQIEGCPRHDSRCGWLEVSETTFQSVEFLGRGNYLFRLYLAGLERFPTFREFHADMTRLDQLAETTGREEDCRLAFARELAERIEKLGRADGVGTPDRLASAEALAERARADVTQLTQARILSTLYSFGYLQRDPRRALAERWVEWLEAGNDSRVLTVSFLTSREYRGRLEE